LDGSLGSSDIDCDGVRNIKDNCIFTYNPNQKDENSNNIGDVCEPDPSGAGVRFLRCDRDSDGVVDEKDNCPIVCNPNQKDNNKNGIGDRCDPAYKDALLGQSPCAKTLKIKEPVWLKSKNINDE